MTAPNRQPDGPPSPVATSEPTERLSFVRLGAALAVLALLVAGVWIGLRRVGDDPVTLDTSWSVPYVDVTLTPSYQFQNPSSNPARDIALAFVVAGSSDPCQPSWGGAYSLDAAGRDLDLDRRILQLRASGGDVMVSFGGQANDELAGVCTAADDLLSAYRSVVERYDLHAIDLDIEGDDLTDAAAGARRATAISVLQRERVDAGERLDVWVTLPVARNGLTDDGRAAVGALLDAGVELAGVNAMTMNFGTADAPTSDMLAATTAALEATMNQVTSIFANHGVTLEGSARWARIGATPMIGQNDVVGEVFTLADAQGLADFALRTGLGRVSFWSLNRDTSCDQAFADVMVLSATCSSVSQDSLDFAEVFTELPGRSAALPQVDAVTEPNQGQVTDDPATSPYPIWRPDAYYPGGYKVVRAGKVYEAKWYNQGDDPAMPHDNPWDTAWALVGPVSPNDAPFTPATLPAGTHPAWDPVTLYDTGEKVLFEGLPYEARWPNKGEAPATLFPVNPDSAWEPLFTIAGEPETP
ncbi:MAG: chitinase [Ilumatobacteraceae bacterium]|nr:hypothetical protein [Ilumatobacter sp.]MCB9381503.1 chitinase [Acidimicrobiaceae bacterium]MCO5328833.1 chitinase [Ilumatobacteraceae bacterium]